jgi:hypothetical protein
MRTRSAALVAAMALALTAAAPASATPDTFEEPIFTAFPDLENGLVVFWNISRDDYCAWEAGGFQGPAPVTERVSGRFNVLPSGAVVGGWAMSSSLELWTLNEDAPLTGPCEDTDDSSIAWATGSARVTSTDNDVFHFESVEAGVIRGNSFGEQGSGAVVDIAGESHRYSWGFRAVDGPQGGYRERAHSELTP